MLNKHIPGINMSYALLLVSIKLITKRVPIADLYDQYIYYIDDIFYWLKRKLFFIGVVKTHLCE